LDPKGTADPNALVEKHIQERSVEPPLLKATFSFVIPSAAEGSAVPRTFPGYAFLQNRAKRALPFGQFLGSEEKAYKSTKTGIEMGFM
jgi:hypothetical protein